MRYGLAIGLLLSLLVKVVMGLSPCRQEDFAARDLAALEMGATLFRRSLGRWPSSLQEMAPPLCQGLGCTLRALHADPWGNAYRLETGPGWLAIKSLGRDGRELRRTLR